MRQIVPRSASPAELHTLQRQFSRPQAQDWDIMHKDYATEYHAIRNLLANDQASFCIYCETCLDLQAPKGKERGHIEHHQPKSLFPRLMFDWANLMFCCLAPHHCGMHKGQTYFSTLLNPYLDPVQDWLEVGFLTGEMTPGPGCPPNRLQDAQRSIELFNLNAPDLMRKRKGVLDELQRSIEAMAEFPDALASFRDDVDITEKPFITARRQLLQKLIP